MKGQPEMKKARQETETGQNAPENRKYR